MNESEEKKPPTRASQASRKQREMLAEFCHELKEQLNNGDSENTGSADTRLANDDDAKTTPPNQGMSIQSIPKGLSPRERQTLELLLNGDGEKQIASRMKISQHTVHGYVKSVYRRFNVSSRAELLSLWVRKG
jgi:DNA-binding CsgD family transcriptional regulator